MSKWLVPLAMLVSGMWPMYELTRLILFTTHGVSKYGWKFSFVIEVIGMWIIYLGLAMAIHVALSIKEKEERKEEH